MERRTSPERQVGLFVKTQLGATALLGVVGGAILIEMGNPIRGTVTALVGLAAEAAYERISGQTE